MELNKEDTFCVFDNLTQSQLNSIYYPSYSFITILDIVYGSATKYTLNYKEYETEHEYICDQNIWHELPNSPYCACDLPDVCKIHLQEKLLQEVRAVVEMKQCLRIDLNPMSTKCLNFNWFSTLFLMLKQNHNLFLKNEAMYLLIQIGVCKKVDRINTLLYLGVVPVIVECLNSKHLDIVLKAVRIIRIFSEFNKTFRHNLINTGALIRMVEIRAKVQSIQVMQNLKHDCEIIIFKLFKNDRLPNVEQVHIIIPTLVEILKDENDANISSYFLLIFRHILAKYQTSIALFIDCEGVEQIVKVLQSQNEELCYQGLTIIESIARAGNHFSEYLLDAGVLNELYNLTKVSLSNHFYAFWFRSISQLCANSDKCVIKIMESDLNEQIMSLFLQFCMNNFDEVIECFFNITKHRTNDKTEVWIKKQIRVLIEYYESASSQFDISCVVHLIEGMICPDQFIEPADKDRLVRMIEECGGANILKTHFIHRL